MRVGLVTDFYYPWVAGPAHVVRNLAQSLTERGHRVSILAPSPNSERYVECEGRVPVHRARTLPIPVGFNLRVSVLAGSDAGEWLRSEHPDVVHIHHPFPLSVSAALAAHIRGTPVAATNHTIPDCTLWGLRHSPAAHTLASRAFGLWIRALMNRCDAVATPTETAAAALRGLGYVRPITVISNGVDTLRFSPGRPDEHLRRSLGLDGRPVVLYTGRLDAEKDMETWVRAAAASGLDAQFLIGGKGTDRERIEGLVRDLALHDRVRFLGYLSDDEYPLLYRLADLYFISAPVELQSITTLEAVASGLPVVAVEAGALPELVHPGENGFLFPPGDWETAAMHLAALIHDNETRDRMGAASRAIGETHDLAHAIDAYERFLERAVSRTEDGHPVLAGTSD